MLGHAARTDWLPWQPDNSLVFVRGDGHTSKIDQILNCFGHYYHASNISPILSRFCAQAANVPTRERHNIFVAWH